MSNKREIAKIAREVKEIKAELNKSSSSSLLDTLESIFLSKEQNSDTEYQLLKIKALKRSVGSKTPPYERLEDFIARLTRKEMDRIRPFWD